MLAHADCAYAAPQLDAPEKVYGLTVEPGMQSLAIPWKEEVLDRPVFRRSIKTADGNVISPDQELPYSTYHAWVKRLGYETGFPQVMTTYCLRRAEGNAINGEWPCPVSRRLAC